MSIRTLQAPTHTTAPHVGVARGGGTKGSRIDVVSAAFCIASVLPLRIAAAAVALRQPGRAAAASVREDKHRWLEERARGIGLEAAAGRSTQLWALVRQLAGRRSRRGPRSIAVLHGEDGRVLQSREEEAAAWEHRFLEEFLNRGRMVSTDA